MSIACSAMLFYLMEPMYVMYILYTFLFSRFEYTNWSYKHISYPSKKSSELLTH